MGTPRPCLFCRDTSKPKTAEHVLQDGFGASLTLPDDVCEDCNTGRFSPLDKRLVDYVRTYAYADHPDVTRNRTIFQDGRCIFFDPSSQLWLHVRVDKQVRPRAFSQVILIGNNQLKFIADTSESSEWQELRDQMKVELSDPSRLAVTTTTFEVNPPVDMLPALLRTAPLTYNIRARSEEGAEAMRKAVESGKLLAGPMESVATENQTNQPLLTFSVAIPFGDIHRALAKTALNFVCAAMGPVVARSPAFDVLRRFALGELPELPSPVTLVAMRPPSEPNPFLFKDGFHSMVLIPVQHVLFLYMGLYGREFAVVEVAQVADLPSKSPIHFGFFDYRLKTSRVLDGLAPVRWTPS